MWTCVAKTPFHKALHVCDDTVTFLFTLGRLNDILLNVARFCSLGLSNKNGLGKLVKSVPETTECNLWEVDLWHVCCFCLRWLLSKFKRKSPLASRRCGSVLLYALADRPVAVCAKLVERRLKMWWTSSKFNRTLSVKFQFTTVSSHQIKHNNIPAAADRNLRSVPLNYI